jgi:hypothetical protein
MTLGIFGYLHGGVQLRFEERALITSKGSKVRSIHIYEDPYRTTFSCTVLCMSWVAHQDPFKAGDTCWGVSLFLQPCSLFLLPCFPSKPNSANESTSALRHQKLYVLLRFAFITMRLRGTSNRNCIYFKS